MYLSVAGLENPVLLLMTVIFSLDHLKAVECTAWRLSKPEGEGGSREERLQFEQGLNGDPNKNIPLNITKDHPITDLHNKDPYFISNWNEMKGIAKKNRGKAATHDEAFNSEGASPTAASENSTSNSERETTTSYGTIPTKRKKPSKKKKSSTGGYSDHAFPPLVDRYLKGTSSSTSSKEKKKRDMVVKTFGEKKPYNPERVRGYRQAKKSGKYRQDYQRYLALKAKHDANPYHYYPWTRPCGGRCGDRSPLAIAGIVFGVILGVLFLAFIAGCIAA